MPWVGRLHAGWRVEAQITTVAALIQRTSAAGLTAASPVVTEVTLDASRTPPVSSLPDVDVERRGFHRAGVPELRKDAVRSRLRKRVRHGDRAVQRHRVTGVRIRGVSRRELL